MQYDVHYYDLDTLKGAYIIYGHTSLTIIDFGHHHNPPINSMSQRNICTSCRYFTTIPIRSDCKQSNASFKTHAALYEGISGDCHQIS